MQIRRTFVGFCYIHGLQQGHWEFPFWKLIIPPPSAKILEKSCYQNKPYKMQIYKHKGVIHLSKLKSVPVSVSVKPPASQVKLKPDSRIWWNHPRSRFCCQNRKKDGGFHLVTCPGIYFLIISKSLLMIGFQHCQELNVSLTGLLNKWVEPVSQ